MRSEEWFRAYERRERQTTHQYAPRAMNGDHVENAELIYQDRKLSKRLGFHRSGAPLSALLFLYEQVVVYVPPAAKQTLRARFNMPWSTFVKLAQRRCVVPIVGHPIHYHGHKHFEALFDTNPVSVWARGDELALEYAGGRDYWAKVEKDHPAGTLAIDPLLTAKYRRVFAGMDEAHLAARVEHEVKTNFVDLCIYGYEPLATALLSPEAGTAGSRKLVELSELITYPSLMGMGGAPNYGLGSANAARMVSDAPRLRPLPRRVGPEAAVLVEGLALATPSHIDPQLVIDFHKDSMSSTLWGALDALEDKLVPDGPGPDDLAERAERAQHLLGEALREVNGAGLILSHHRSLGRINDVVRLTMKLSPVIPLATFFWSPFDQQMLDAGVSVAGAAVSGAAIWKSNAIADTIERKLAHHLSSRRLDKMTAQLWWLSEWTASHRG